jgi:hypothetical protein
MRRLLVILAVLSALLAMSATTAQAASSKQLRCFADSPATCTLGDSGSSAFLDVPAGADAGVYYINGKRTGRTLSSVDYTFQYRCSDVNAATAGDCVNGGSPRWSIPIDTNGDGKVDGYAFIDAAGCGYTSDYNVVHVVSTTLSNCQVTFQGVTYANWDTFAADNPTYRIGNALPFVIADQPFQGQVFGVVVTK